MLAFDSLDDEDGEFVMNPGRTATPVRTTDPIFPISVHRYHAIIEAGLLHDQLPTELLGGVLTFKKRKTPPRTYTVGQTRDHLYKLLGDAFDVYQFGAITCDDSEPEPDVMVTREDSLTVNTFPHPADVFLVIEVVDENAQVDRGTKRVLYGRVGIEEYWIIDVVTRTIEALTQPNCEGYASCAVHAATDTIALPAMLGGATIAVADLLPPAA